MKLIVGNLKMNLLTSAERDRYCESLLKEWENKKLTNTEMVVCPPVLHLENFVQKFGMAKVAVGAQNIFWEERGSFTGEISPLMVRNFGAEYVLVGHSERRKYFGETDAIFNAKIQAALRNDLSVIFCVGETRAEKNAGQTSEVIAAQIKEGLAEIPSNKIGRVVLAYEPVWAVGSDLVPIEDEIMAVRILIKKLLLAQFSKDAEKIKILYGGSVSSRTVEQVCVKPGMDGVLVGRESLIPSEFIKIAAIIDKEI